MSTEIKASTAVPQLAEAVGVSYYDGQHNVHQVIGHVLSVGPISPGAELPELTVAFPKSPADAKLLSSVKWADGYARQASVQHISHPDVKAGKASIAWGGSVGQTDAPSVPRPAGDATNPIFARQDDPEARTVSIEQAGAVQLGRVPQPTVGTPLLNEPAESVPGGPVLVEEQTPTPDTFAADNAAGEATGNAEEHAQEVGAEEHHD